MVIMPVMMHARVKAGNIWEVRIQNINSDIEVYQGKMQERTIRFLSIQETLILMRRELWRTRKTTLENHLLVIHDWYMSWRVPAIIHDKNE